MTHRKSLLGLCLLLATAVAAPASVAQTPAAPAAPFVPPTGPMRMADMPLHDPFIVAEKESGTYYLYTSNNARLTGVRGVGTMAYTSKDLKTWDPPKVVFTLPDTGVWADAGGWAPEVHKWRGKYWLFVTLHNDAMKLPKTSSIDVYRRGTVLAVADTPAGPFKLVRDGEPIIAPDHMTLDGTLYVDEAGKPWAVYAHEWLQTVDGTIEAAALDDDLKATGPSTVLFHASQATWVGQPQNAPPLAPGVRAYVTDGPQLYRMKSGALVTLWSSYDDKGYVESQAVSRSGKVTGPWEQLPPLLYQDSGHGMIFDAFDGTRLLIVHRPFRNARGKIYEVRDAGDRFEIVRQRVDLDGDVAVGPKG
jgi:beta-xylosidase